MTDLSAKLAKCTLAFVAVLLLCCTAMAEDQNGATVSVFGNERGSASVHYAIWIDKPLGPEQVRVIESAIGARLDGPALFDDDGDDDDDSRDAARPRDSAQAPYVYTAQRTVALERRGFRFEGDVDLAGLAAALERCGIREIGVVVSHPKKVDPWTSPSSTSFPLPIRDLDSSVYRFDLVGSDPTDLVVHIAYGDPGPAAGWRLATLLAVSVVAVAAVIWFRRLALREVEKADGTPSLAHTRFVKVVSLALPVCWWMTFSITDIRSLVDYRFGFVRTTELAVAEGLIGVALPCLIFWACALIWGRVWRVVPVRVSTPGDPSRSPLDLFLGSFLPLLSFCGTFFYFFEYEFAVGAAFLIAGTAAGRLRRKLLVKPAELEMYVLLAPELRQRIFDLASRAKVKLREVLVLPETGRRIANAFAASNNTVWLCEYLLRRLSRKEVDAVIAHELGHLKRGHPLLRVIALLGALLAGLFVSILLRAAFMLRLTEAPVRHLNLVFPVSLAFGIVVSSFLARRQEYAADWWSVRINGDPEAMITGLVRITRDGQLPMNWSKWDEKLLSHPSTLRRAARLARKSGITKERLTELLNVPAEPDECYSLAAGSSGAPVMAASVETAEPKETQKKSKNRTRYRRRAWGRGLIAFYLAMLAVMLGPEMLGLDRNLLAFPTGLYCLASAVIFGILICGLTARSQKRKLSQLVTGPVTSADASLDQFSGLDVASVNACTAELESLGFEPKGDYRVEMTARNSLRHFWRVFASQEHNCWAQVRQAVTDTLGVTKVSCSFASDLGDGYALYTSNAEPVAALYAALMPREIRVHVPGAAPAELLGIHLARRERIMAAAGLVPQAVSLRDDYLSFELDRAADRRRVIERRNSWLFLRRMDKFNRKPKLEWTGKDKRINTKHPGLEQSIAGEIQRA